MNKLFAFTVTTILALAACGGGGKQQQQEQQPTGPFASCVPQGAATTCFAFPLSSGSTADAVCAADTENAETWVSVASCPSDNLVGCCGMNNTWQCFYGSTGSSPEDGCTGDGGMWITKAP